MPAVRPFEEIQVQETWWSSVTNSLKAVPNLINGARKRLLSDEASQSAHKRRCTDDDFDPDHMPAKRSSVTAIMEQPTLTATRSSFSAFTSFCSDNSISVTPSASTTSAPATDDDEMRCSDDEDDEQCRLLTASEPQSATHSAAPPQATNAFSTPNYAAIECGPLHRRAYNGTDERGARFYCRHAWDEFDYGMQPFYSDIY